MKLLTTSNPKLMKGQTKGYLSFVLHLAPSDLSGYNVCPMASEGCRAACLNTAGRGRFTNIQEARIRKTRWYFEDRDTFMRQLVMDIQAGIRKAERENLTPVFRLNGTSDIRWETIPVEVHGVEYQNLMEAFSWVMFYDYSAIPNRKNIPSNYHLTFSRKENNDNNVAIAMSNGMNVAIVFEKELPETYMGRGVVNGDDTDLRFLDPVNVVVGLKAKGRGKRDTSGFVILQK